MLLSMTGFGRVSKAFRDKTITVEIRSLNSKFLDIRMKMPQNYKEKEIIMRKMISESAQRGKVDFSLEINSIQGDEEYGLNKSLFKKYYRELTELQEDLDLDKAGLTQAILRLPNVIASEARDIEEDEWQAVKETLEDCLAVFYKFRRTEGKVLAKDLELRSKSILSYLEKVDPFEKMRIKNMRQRLQQNLNEFLGKENVDKNRFEQEVIFYLEKIDINEEKVRLRQHCEFFVKNLLEDKELKGRKLSFISQEMGREINTLGAKAYSSDIQKLVVMMKDDLEKIKEQLANCV